MSHKILFAGIDGSGKSSCLDLLISKLESKYSIVKIGGFDPYVFFKGERKLVVKYRWYWILDYLRPVTKKYHFYGVFLIWNFIYKFLIVKYIELFKKIDIIMYDTDILLHPAVYIGYHLSFTRIIKNNMRFKIVDVLFRTKRNSLIFYLDTEPEVAMERIHKRGIGIDSHENIRDLKRLKKEFDDIIEIALKKEFEIIRINTNGKTLGEVVNEIQIVLEKKLYASGI